MEKNDLRTELNPFEMLEELLWQDQFELIFPENEKQSELRLVYLMNDAVESFLVFINAKMTGQYQPDYEGELEAELSKEDTEDGCIYVLVVHQGDSVVTLFFEDLKVETHLYRSGAFLGEGIRIFTTVRIPHCDSAYKMRVSGGGCCRRRRAKTGGTGAFSTFELCLLSGCFTKIYCADGWGLGTDRAGNFHHGGTGSRS